MIIFVSYFYRVRFKAKWFNSLCYVVSFNDVSANCYTTILVTYSAMWLVNNLSIRSKNKDFKLDINCFFFLFLKLINFILRRESGYLKQFIW